MYLQVPQCPVSVGLLLSAAAPGVSGWLGCGTEISANHLCSQAATGGERGGGVRDMRHTGQITNRLGAYGTSEQGTLWGQ